MYRRAVMIAVAALCALLTSASAASASGVGGVGQAVSAVSPLSLPPLPPLPPRPPAAIGAPASVPVTSPVSAAPRTTRRSRVVLLTNAARAAAGLRPLRVELRLTTSAKQYALHLAADGAFSHTDGSDLTTRAQAVGYRFRRIGENLGLGQTKPRTIVEAWMDSPEHRANMLDPMFTEIGVGIATRADGQIVWCVDLGRPSR